jgi:hypothetical protein
VHPKTLDYSISFHVDFCKWQIIDLINKKYKENLKFLPECYSASVREMGKLTK